MRTARLRALLQDSGLDAIVISQPENRRYLSGFTGSAGYLIISQEAQFFATDFRYYEQVSRQCPDWKLFKVGYEFIKQLPDLLAEVKAQRVGFESASLSVAEFEKWRAAADKVEWVPTENLVESLRMVKEPKEVDIIRQAVAIADKSFQEVLLDLRPGLPERDIAWALETAMRRRGATKASFDIIVASGPNGAMPHAGAGERPVQAGEPVIIDMGCLFNGYCSDLTRTICLGKPDSRFGEIYGLVLEAQKAAEAGIKAGMTARQADGLARQVIADAGYGESFGHGLGHGVGLAIHEGPRVSYASEDFLPAGVVITVEPGIYLPGWGGVRIEDMAIVGEDGLEVLTRASKEPVIVC